MYVYIYMQDTVKIKLVDFAALTLNPRPRRGEWMHTESGVGVRVGSLETLLTSSYREKKNSLISSNFGKKSVFRRVFSR